MQKITKNTEQCSSDNVSCWFVLKYKLSDSYYKYTVGGCKVWSGDIKLARKFKYKFIAYMYLMMIDWKDSVVFKTCKTVVDMNVKNNV